MKIRMVRANNRRRAFEVHTSSEVYSYPYALAKPQPTTSSRIREVQPDPELGREGFTYVLADGREGSIHMDQVLEYNKDPGYKADLVLYKLTLEAQRRVERSVLSREAAYYSSPRAKRRSSPRGERRCAVPRLKVSRSNASRENAYELQAAHPKSVLGFSA